MDISVDKEAGKVRVDISADLTAEELRDLLGKLGKAHGDLTDSKSKEGEPLWRGLVTGVGVVNGAEVLVTSATQFGTVMHYFDLPLARSLVEAVSKATAELATTLESRGKLVQ